jgi:hypothetical protein
MLRDLANVGWTADGMRVPEHEAYDQNFIPLGYKVTEIHVIARGSGPFGGWTAEEKKVHMANARSVLRKYGFPRAPVWTKTLADML